MPVGSQSAYNDLGFNMNDIYRESVEGPSRNNDICAKN